MADPGLALLTVTQAVGLFQSFLPKFTEISAVDPADNPQLVRDVRRGEVAAVVLTLGIGAMASGFTDSPVPAISSAVAAFTLIVLYEGALSARNGVSENA
jgi:hypothetical protein